jgi:hypothetical protein
MAALVNEQGCLRRVLSNLEWQSRLLISVRMRIGRNSNRFECCSPSCEQRSLVHGLPGPT